MFGMRQVSRLRLTNTPENGEVSYSSKDLTPEIGNASIDLGVKRSG